MKKISLFITLICTYGFMAVGFSQSTYTHDDFEITFLFEPTVTEQEIPMGNETVTLKSLMNEDTYSAHMLSFSNYPDSYIINSKPQDILQTAKGGFINSLQVSVVDEKKIKIDGYEGLYFKASGNGFYCVMKDYLVGNRLYQMGILRSDRYPTDMEVKSFVDSFKLISKNIDNKEIKPMKEK